MSSESSAERRLDGIDAKLNRVEEHFDNLDDYALPWVTERKSWYIARDVNEGDRRYIFTLRLIKPCPPAVAVIADEIVHHLRSSLDHLACHLVEASGGQVTNSTAWPLTDSEWEWNREVERRKRPFQPWRKKGGGRLSGASPEARAFVRGHQPDMRGGKTRDDPLTELEKLWNAEKHRVLNAIRLYAKPTNWRDLFPVTPDIEPVQFKWLARPEDELKLNTTVKWTLFRFPKNRPLPNVDVKGQLPVEVAMGDGKGDRIEIKETLDLVRGIVGEARQSFPPP